MHLKTKIKTQKQQIGHVAQSYQVSDSTKMCIKAVRAVQKKGV